MAAASFIFKPPPPLPFLHSFSKSRPPALLTILSPLSTTSTSTTALLYGPSLRKGRRTATTPPQLPTVSADDQALVDRDAFARVFDVAALRVPAGRCSTLEARLRGHLLNWPRVRNIARVPGDDVDPPSFNRLLPLDGYGEGEGGDVSRSVDRRLYGSADGDGQRLSAVLYRDELAKTFDCRGYLKFRNLARISRPARKVKTKKKKEEGVAAAVKSGIDPRAAHRNDYAVVRVVDEVGDGGKDMAGLLGEGFRGDGWRGSTRLLLLDERYANKGVEDLPESIKVAAFNTRCCD